MRLVALGVPTDTVFGSVATDPAPRATLLGAPACTLAPLPNADPPLAATDALVPTAVLLAAFAMAPLP
jgi:hypothetical protein